MLTTNLSPSSCQYLLSSFFFFFHYTPPTEIYTLSLHDALPICSGALHSAMDAHGRAQFLKCKQVSISRLAGRDRKSTRLNSSHTVISYAVFCLKKKKKKNE